MTNAIRSGLLAAALCFPVLGQAAPTVCNGQSADVAGAGSEQHTLPVPGKPGINVEFYLHEPTTVACGTDLIGKHPLLLHGPGFGGSASTSGFASYRDAGYAVISWSPLGFGGSGGTVRVMDPEFEGQAYLAILDWAEQNLDYLSWRNEASGNFVPRPSEPTSVANGDNLVVGAIGGSYGGGYQLMILATDAKKRLDAIAPDITWHDLRNSLNPGDTVKTVWDLALSALGGASGESSFNYFGSDSDGIRHDGLDPYIKETLARGASLNEFSRESQDWFHYRGLGYWCAANGLPAMPITAYEPDVVPMLDLDGAYNVPPPTADGVPGLGSFLQAVSSPANEHFAGLRVLLTQGMIDTLFDYSEAWWNAQCLRATGASVSLYTHNGGHVLPSIQSPDSTGSDSGSCSVSTQSWLSADLLPGSEPVLLADTCFALGGGNDDTVFLDFDEVLAPQPLGGNQRFVSRSLGDDIPGDLLPGVVVPNGVSGSANLTGNAPVAVSLGALAADAVLAGMARLEVTVSSLAGANGPLTNAGGIDCRSASFPTRVGCDSITFVGLGKKSGSSPNFVLIDDQVQPMRGLGEHAFDLVGTAERFSAGDEIAVLFYATHPMFFGSVSRDTTLPAIRVDGDIHLPLYAVDADGQPDAGLWADQLLPGGQDEPADSDGDGVPDPEDQCPDTPSGTTVDADGCAQSNETDTDGDGVADTSDQCPDTESGRPVDAFGCPASGGEVTISSFTVSPSSIDVTNGPVDVTLNVTASTTDAYGGDLSYVYYFGDGTNSGVTEAVQVTHAYDKAGSYTVSVVAVDENSNSASQSAVLEASTTVTVDEEQAAIVAVLSVTPANGTAPVTVTADASGSSFPSGATFRFDFGDGTVITGQRQRVSHVYAVDGSYTVRLTVSAGGESDSQSQTVVVGSPQQTTALLTVTPARVNVGQTVTFDARDSLEVTSEPITAFLFDFGDGTTERREIGDGPGQFGTRNEAALTSHIYDTAQVFEVSVTVNPEGVASKAGTRVIVVDSAAEAPDTPAAPVSPPRSARNGGSGALGLPLLALVIGVGTRRRRRRG